MRLIFYASPIRSISPRAAINIVRTNSTFDLVNRIYGSSPTPDSEAIFVLHGLLGSKRNWQSMAEMIAAHTNKPVITPDARNHGDSPHSDSHSYSDLAADLSQLISRLSIKKSIIIGHSMGGRTGMVLALQEPSKVSNLIVVDISPFTKAQGRALTFLPTLLNAMMSVEFKGVNTLDEARTAAKNQLMNTKLFDDERAISFFLMNIAKLDNSSFGWKCNVRSLLNNFGNIASFPNLNGKTYDGPTLFIGGKRSKFISPDDITGIRKLFPKANLIYIEDAGHNVHADNPKSFFNAVVQFLSFKNAKN